MSKGSLRESARGQECHLRLPNVCTGDPEQTVLAHIRRGNVAGIGQKPPDVCAVFACAACHDAIDRRSNLGGYTVSDLDGYILEGHMRTLKWWCDRGYLAMRA